RWGDCGPVREAQGALRQVACAGAQRGFRSRGRTEGRLCEHDARRLSHRARRQRVFADRGLPGGGAADGRRGQRHDHDLLRRGKGCPQLQRDGRGQGCAGVHRSLSGSRSGPEENSGQRHFGWADQNPGRARHLRHGGDAERTRRARASATQCGSQRGGQHRRVFGLRRQFRDHRRNHLCGLRIQHHGILRSADYVETGLVPSHAADGSAASRVSTRGLAGSHAMTERADDEAGRPPSTGFWGSLFKQREVAPLPADPLHCDTPMLRHAEIAAVYTGQRVAGDFYEFLRVGPSRMLFVLLDIAGLRADTREILIAVQKTFQTLAPELFAGEDFNETTAMIELCIEMNLTILRGGLRSCPAFIGCYNEDLGTVCYANAGHTPGLLRDHTGITLLEATGLPLGLFSHTTQSAAACHLVPGSALLGVSRGIVESDYFDAERHRADFGLDGVKQSFQHSTALSARELCLTVLQAARMFTPATPTENDLTALALVRNAAQDVV